MIIRTPARSGAEIRLRSDPPAARPHLDLQGAYDQWAKSQAAQACLPGHWRAE